MGSAQAMRFQYTPYFGALMMTAVISAVVAFIAWQRRATPGGTPLALLMLAVTESCIGQSAEEILAKWPDIAMLCHWRNCFTYRSGAKILPAGMVARNSCWFSPLCRSNTHRRAEQLRVSFEALQVEYEGAELSTTISAVVAVFPNHGETDEDLLRAADQALYAAKAAGRNCVKIWQ
jgi:GGDEF domain-containing protein